MTTECILFPYLRLRFIHATESKAYHMKLIQQNDNMFLFVYSTDNETLKCYKNNLFSRFKTAVLYYYDFFLLN